MGLKRKQGILCRFLLLLSVCPLCQATTLSALAQSVSIHIHVLVLVLDTADTRPGTWNMNPKTTKTLKQLFFRGIFGRKARKSYGINIGYWQIG